MTPIDEEELRLEIWSAFCPGHKDGECYISRLCEDCEYSVSRTVRIIKAREAALTQQHEREKREDFDLAQQAFQRSLAAMKDFYELEKLRAVASVTTDKGDAYYQGVPTWRLREQLQEQKSKGGKL